MALKKTPNPTFKALVAIPVPGEKPEKVEFTFHYKNKTEYIKYSQEATAKTDEENIIKLIHSWGLNEQYGEPSEEGLAELFDTYPGAAMAILETYHQELYGARLGN